MYQYSISLLAVYGYSITSVIVDTDQNGFDSRRHRCVFACLAVSVGGREIEREKEKSVSVSGCLSVSVYCIGVSLCLSVYYIGVNLWLSVYYIGGSLCLSVYCIGVVSTHAADCYYIYYIYY